MSAASNYLEIKLLDHSLRGASGAYTAPTTVYVALFSDSGSGAASALESGDATTGASTNWGYYEINNGSYQREPAAFSAATSTGTGTGTAGSITTSGDISFNVATADYDTAGSTGNVVTHLAIIDSQTAGAGNVLFYGALTNSKTVNSGDQFTISAGNLTVSLA